ncbi:MAG: glycosyltransferase [Thermoleophilia bacterium]
MRVAYLSPLPPERSGIADYSALLLPALRERIQVEVVPHGKVRGGGDCDVALYHVGNNPEAHGWIVDALRRRPGMVVLHEHVLHHLVAGTTLGRGNAEAYRTALHRDAGAVGRLLAHGVIDGLVPPLWETRPQDFPLCGEVLDHARGLIVHSATVEAAAREHGYEGPLWRIPHPAWPAPTRERDPDVPQGRGLVVGCFGNLNPAKRVPQLLAAFARLRATQPGATLVLAGAASPAIGLDDLLARHGLAGSDAVVRLDYVDEARLWRLLASVDVCVCLRHPTMGETSGIALRSLSVGCPLVVSDVGWFSELPGDVAAKVPVDDWEADTLAAVLALLGEDAGLRARMGEAALALAHGAHDLARVAERYVAAIEELAGNDDVRTRVLHEVAVAAADVGLDAGGAEVGELARLLREVGV